jgi:hypothetical protein
MAAYKAALAGVPHKEIGASRRKAWKSLGTYREILSFGGMGQVGAVNAKDISRHTRTL